MKALFLYAMAALYLLAGANHFRSPETYLPMMPPYIPMPSAMIALSGLAELLLGAGLLLRRSRALAAWGVIALLVAISPVHVYMYEARETVFANLPTWLLIARLPLQLALMAWAYAYTRPGGLALASSVQPRRSPRERI